MIVRCLSIFEILFAREAMIIFLIAKVDFTHVSAHAEGSQNTDSANHADEDAIIYLNLTLQFLL